MVELASLIEALPPEVATQFGGLVTILQAIGIVAIIYFAFLIIKSFFDIQRGKKIVAIYTKLEGMEKQLKTIERLARGNQKELDTVEKIEGLKKISKRKTAAQARKVLSKKRGKPKKK